MHRHWNNVEVGVVVVAVILVAGSIGALLGERIGQRPETARYINALEEDLGPARVQRLKHIHCPDKLGERGVRRIAVTMHVKDVDGGVGHIYVVADDGYYAQASGTGWRNPLYSAKFGELITTTWFPCSTPDAPRCVVQEAEKVLREIAAEKEEQHGIKLDE